MEDSVGDIIPKLDFGVIFRSKFDDWFSDCQNGFGEGPFCSQKGLKPTLQNSLLNSIAKGTINQNQLIAIVYNVEAESYEKVFRLISQSNVGRVFVTSKSQNSALQMDQWEEFGRSVVGNWPSCGCWDINECTMGRSSCNEEEICINALGSFHCFNPSEPIPSVGREFSGLTRSCTTSCDSNGFCNADTGQCECNAGFSGDGVDCNTSSQANRLAIPIRKIPDMENQVLNGETVTVCTDPYWNDIANLDLASVILRYPDKTWQPCIQLLYENGHDVYWWVDLYVAGSWVEDWVRNTINAVYDDFNGKVGVHLYHHGVTYKDDLTYSAIATAKGLGMKVRHVFNKQFLIRGSISGRNAF